MSRLHPIVFWIAGAKLAVHLVFIRGYGWFRDEFYYIACSEHLDWGYVDHPPLVAVVTALTRGLLGDSIVAVRLPAALAGAASVVVAGLLARELGAQRFGQGLAALAVLAAPVYLSLQHVLSMNAWEPLLWAGVALFMIRALDRGRVQEWICAGVLAGIALQNKHSMLFFGFALVVGLVISPVRRVLLVRGPWVMAAVAAAIFLPNVVWQVRHGWPTLEFMEHARAYKNVALAPGTFVLQQVLIMNPANALVWVSGLTWLLVAPAARAWRFLGWGYLALLALLMLTGGKDYYLAAYYPLLFASGAVALERWSATSNGLPPEGGSHRHWMQTVRAGLPALLLLTAAALAPLAMPILPVESYLRYARAIGVQSAPSERHAMGRLPQFFADMFGWRELADAVVRAAGTLPPGEREKAVIFVHNYGEAGAIDFLGRGRGAPPAVSGHNSYWFWGPGRARRDVLLILGGDRDDHRECGSLEQAGTFTCTDCMPYENDQPIWVCRNLQVSIEDAWRAAKSYN
jgi:4-amino-4-deoxy-L-arabinose transferase-like glycosyltransferase